MAAGRATDAPYASTKKIMLSVLHGWTPGPPYTAEAMERPWPRFQRGGGVMQMESQVRGPTPGAAAIIAGFVAVVASIGWLTAAVAIWVGKDSLIRGEAVRSTGKSAAGLETVAVAIATAVEIMRRRVVRRSLLGQISSRTDLPRRRAGETVRSAALVT